MTAPTLRTWMKQFESRFDERELTYMTVHKARIVLQMKDMETREIHLHELVYKSKEAEHLSLKDHYDGGTGGLL